MSSPSNLYAEKIYAEQPIALWSLDDDCTFASYFSSSDLNLKNWSGTTITELSQSTPPFPKIVQSNFVSVSVPSNGNIEIQSPSTFSSSVNFSAGIWINPQKAMTSVVFTVGSMTKTFDISGSYGNWTYLSHVFETTNLTSTSFKIKINGGTETGTVFLNGFSIGVNQNLFGSYSIGNQLSQLPSPLSSYYGVQAIQYGISEYPGWYIGNNTSKIIYVKNSSLPLVYGASTSTVLYKNPNGPSVILPGMGFLNNKGKNQTLTFEAWLRIKTDGVKQSSPFRIFGPLDSSDGLYVNGQHLMMVIGNKFTSHYVGEWFRPMLINIEYTPTLAKLFVNGETVATLDVDNNLLSTGNDYLGFFVGGNISFIELDCVAVYPYKSSSVVLKRRYGYAQAVTLPAEIENAYSGKQIMIDYTYAGYTKNYIYPTTDDWTKSISDNADANTNTLSSPKLSKPSVIFANGTSVSDWESSLVSSNKSDNPSVPYIKLNNTGYIAFNTIKQDSIQQVRAFYIVCDHDLVDNSVDEVIFRLQNKNNFDSISAIRSSNLITYYYNIGGKTGTIGSPITITANTKFTVGLDPKTIPSTNTLINNFMLSINNYALYVGGDYSGNDEQIKTTFSGKIYKIAICSDTNFAKQSMSSIFTYGLPNSSSSAFLSKKSSYEYKMTKQTFGSNKIYYLTTSSASYWQNNIPLPVFAKYVKDTNGSDIYVSDMIQVSIDSESSSVINSSNIDTTSVDIKLYSYFVYSDELAKIGSFGEGIGLSTQQLDYSKVIDATSNWKNTRFEMIDGTVMFLPKTNFDASRTQNEVSLVSIIEFYSDDTDNLPIKIRTLEYASQTFERGTSTSFNKSLGKSISSRTGNSEIYQFVKTGNVFDYSAKNPISISKSMTPHLYATNKTGIKVMASYSNDSSRGLYIPLNKDSEPNYFISVISSYIMYNENSIPNEITIFEITDYQYGKLRLCITPFQNDNTYGYLSVKKQSGLSWVEISNVDIYINGRYTSSPTISAKEWYEVGLSFTSSPVNASSRSDFYIGIVGSVSINNFSYFKLRSEELEQQVLPNSWATYDNGDHKWQDYDTEKTWSQISASQSFLKPSLTPNIISDVYYGTNKIIAVSEVDSTGIRLQNYEYNLINDVVWQKTTVTSP